MRKIWLWASSGLASTALSLPYVTSICVGGEHGKAKVDELPCRAAALPCSIAVHTSPLHYLVSFVPCSWCRTVELDRFSCFFRKNWGWFSFFFNWLVLVFFGTISSFFIPILFCYWDQREEWEQLWCSPTHSCLGGLIHGRREEIAIDFFSHMIPTRVWRSILYLA